MVALVGDRSKSPAQRQDIVVGEGFVRQMLYAAPQRRDEPGRVRRA